MQSTPAPNSRLNARGSIGTVSSLIITVLLLVASASVYLNKQYLLDSLHFWQYKPAVAVQSITQRSGMSDTGTFLFYAAQPEVDDNKTFNSHCGRTEQSTAILGCYTNDKIYIYDVPNDKLDGIEEVTSSHEMLHVAYQRLSDAERQRIDTLVEEEYKKLSSDPSFSERMAYYTRAEPGERDNELHSIIGTEVTTLNPELESHYAKYFSDRSKVVALSNKYNEAFAKLAGQKKLLSDQIQIISKEIASSKTAYEANLKLLTADIETFKSRASSGGFATRAAMTSELNALNSRIDKINADRNEIKATTEHYNELINEYNSTITESNDLYESIDSSVTPAPKV